MIAADGVPPAFPWAAAMAFGLGTLRLSGEVFWRLTPRELAAAMAAFTVGPAQPTERAALEALMRRFPDL